MDVFHSTDKLVEHSASFGLMKPLLFGYVVEELPILYVLHHQEQLFLCLNDFVELDDVGVAYQLQNMNLASHSFYIWDISYLILVDDLYSDHLACLLMGCQFDLSECALP